MLEGCGSRLAIRAKSSTNPGGRGLGLRFQRVDLEEKHDIKFHKKRWSCISWVEVDFSHFIY